MPSQNQLIYSAFRIGQIDTLLHDDVQAVLPAPGIIKASLQGERAWREQLLKASGINTKMLFDSTSPIPED